MRFSKQISILVLGLSLSGAAFAGRKPQPVPMPPPPPPAAPTPTPTPVPELNNDARFTYAKAYQYFTHARLASSSELIGSWVQMGRANSPASREAGWYSPDGTRQYASVNYPWGGLGYSMHTFKLVSGAFGEGVLVVERNVKAQKDGLIAGDTAMEEVKALREGSVYIAAGGGEDSCNRAVTCRLVTPSDLLCASVTTNNYQCDYAQGQTYAYTVFKRASLVLKRAEEVRKPAPKTSAKKSPVLK